jgi:hypothetical protein
MPIKGEMMTRPGWLKILNPVLFLAALWQTATGVAYFLGWGDRVQTAHLAGGLLMALAAVLHLALNWNWIRSSYFTRKTIGKG